MRPSRAAVLQQLALGIIALEFGAVLFDRGRFPARPATPRSPRPCSAWSWWSSSATRSCPRSSSIAPRAGGCARLVWPIRLLLWLMTPITVFVRFFFSVAALAEPPASPEEETAVDVEALLEAGEEEGILEENDIDLVRSAVEFGDKLVREVMTPRPAVFAVPESITLEQFLEAAARAQLLPRPRLLPPRWTTSPASPLPTTCCRSPTRKPAPAPSPASSAPAAFVPETKRGYELLREMQREKQHMRIVIDEYGGVAGLVTIEDLLEQIVGNIRDEHEEDASRRAAARAGRRLGGPGQLPRRPACRSLWRAAGTGRRRTKPPPWAAWSARSRAASRWPAKWCCWSTPACAWKLSPPPTAASTACACFRRVEQQTAESD